jgi:hypothetical protein
MDISTNILSRRVVLDQDTKFDTTVGSTGIECDRKSSIYDSSFSVVENNWLDKLWGEVRSLVQPESFTEENRKTVSYFKRHLLTRVGKSRLQRICRQANVDLDCLEKDGKALTTRDIEKIVVLLKDVTLDDIQDLISSAKEDEDHIRFLPKDVQDALKSANRFEDLPASALVKLYNISGKPFLDEFNLSRICDPISGKPTVGLACYIHDHFLSVRERLQLCEDNGKRSEMAFLENLTKAISYKDMDVGTLIPAYKDEDGVQQFYRVSAALFTGKGHISYILRGATTDSKLESVRIHRGSVFRSSGFDTMSSFVTDFERDIGREAFESAEPYEALIRQLFPHVETEIGHSLGACVIQYRAACHEYIKKVHLFNSPGVPVSIVDKFNALRAGLDDHFELNVIRCSQDIVDKAGEVSLGYKAPDSVDVNLVKFKQIGNDAKLANHNVIFYDKSEDSKNFKYHKYEGENKLNRKFNNLERSNIESVRHYVGGLVLAPLFKIARAMSRSLWSNSRINKSEGFHVENFSDGRWSVRHIQPNEVEG